MKPDVFKVFEKELNLVTDEEVFRFTVSAFKYHCPDYFWTIPASVRGHHPAICRTRGGLVHHTKLGVAFAKQLLDGANITCEDPRFSQVIAATLLHDMMKRGSTEDESDFADHKTARGLHGRYCAMILARNYCITAILEPVIAAIRLHMGRWTKDCSQTELAILEAQDVPRIVHAADYMSSRSLVYERYMDKTMEYLYE